MYQGDWVDIHERTPTVGDTTIRRGGLLAMVKVGHDLIAAIYYPDSGQWIEWPGGGVVEDVEQWAPLMELPQDS